MEGLLLLVVLVILVLLIVFNSTINSKLDKLQADVQLLQEKLGKALENRQPAAPPAREAAPIRPVAPVAEPEPLLPVKAAPEPEPLPVPPMPQAATLPPVFEAAPVPKPAPPPVVPPPVPPTPPPLPRPGFFERNPDLEKFIGENLISKIGIAILVIAIGIFVKFAIDNEWIGPIGRVAIGLLCGGILTGIAHRLHRSYKAFSSVLIGGGLAVFYFSIGLAYKDYSLLSQPVAFTILVLITAFAVVLSLLYDRQEVAVLALIGGFCVPFIVSNGSGNYAALFTYLLLLNTGLLIIAYRKAWRLLNGLAFLFTVLLFGIWMGSLPAHTPHSTFRDGFLFATAFYLLFMAINIAHNVRQQQRFIASDFGIILATTALYFGAGLSLVYHLDGRAFTGLFSGGLGAFNLLLCFLLYRNRNVDKNVLYLLIGITLTFISLTIPLQLHGHYITLFWASECVLLYWLYQRSAIALTRVTSIIIWVCMLISLLMDWTRVYAGNGPLLPPLGNKGFITTLYAAMATYCLYLLRRREASLPEPARLFLPRQVFLSTGLLLLYLAGFLELQYQFSSRLNSWPLTALYVVTYTYLFVLVIYQLSCRQQLHALPAAVPVVMMALSLLLYLFTDPVSFMALKQLLLSGRNEGHFMIHWLGAVLAGAMIYQLVQHTRQRFLHKTNTILPWVYCTLVIIFLSSELALLTYQLCYRNPASLAVLGRIYSKAGLSIIWSLCSFAFMWLGMRHKFRPLRIISLTLFLVTLIKLFAYDISNLPVAGKIAAFFCLGILLLVVSFMYQRLKKIITEDGREPEQ